MHGYDKVATVHLSARERERDSKLAAEFLPFSRMVTHVKGALHTHLHSVTEW